MNGATSARANRRLDQWLWFARFAKSRSLAARLSAAGMVAVNGARVKKPSHPVRVGDAVAVILGGVRHNVQVLSLGTRRGPAGEARLLYAEIAAPARLPPAQPDWIPLLEGGPASPR